MTPIGIEPLVGCRLMDGGIPTDLEGGKDYMIFKIEDVYYFEYILLIKRLFYKALYTLVKYEEEIDDR